MDIGSLFKSLHINTYYKYLLYISGIILILSVIQTYFCKNCSSLPIIWKSSLLVMATSILVWIEESAYNFVSNYVYEDFIDKGSPKSIAEINAIDNGLQKSQRKRYLDKMFIISCAYFVIQVLLWAIAIIVIRSWI